MPYTCRFLVILILAGIFTSAQARVTGQCANCHTMHNRQGGQPMTLSGSDTPNPALLIADCVGCHTGTNDGSNTTPYVLDANVPQYRVTGTEADSNTLAGGNFYWVANISDRMGHNVQGLAGPDGILSVPPGGDGSFSSQLSCAGSTGCHGRNADSEEIVAMRGSHHYKDQAVWQNGATLAGSYRFLNTTKGLGDPDYEFHPYDQRHNKYYGLDRTDQTQEAAGTISALCARCHNYYHDGADSVVSGTTFGAGIWIRHPTDFDMSRASSSSEYAEYNGGSGTGNLYSVISPVATADTTSSVNDTVYSISDDAVVMCLSCHRAHGTPYNAMLRWDYKSWPGGGYNGCAVCHTSKD